MQRLFDRIKELPPPPAPDDHQPGFTLPELLIAVSIFAFIATITGSLYTSSIREVRHSNLEHQIYADAQYLMDRIAAEVQNNMVDYDEYYNRHVVIPSLVANELILGASGIQHYGQNYGRYYSSFFHTGTDDALGFDCNKVEDGRNKPDCTPLRKTLDRHTGTNPFLGKYSAVGIASEEQEDAFCGSVTYDANAPGRPDNFGVCQSNKDPDVEAERVQDELYLISAEGDKKTIFAREKISATAYALSYLRLKGVDSNNDGLSDRFVCADEFQCRGGDAFDVQPDSVAAANSPVVDASCFSGSQSADLPRSRRAELESITDPESDEYNPNDICDPPSQGFTKDFVPLSPFRVSVSRLNFFVSPSENPQYAFGETIEQKQPRVTITLTVEPNPQYTAGASEFAPVTLVETVSSKIRTPISAPLLVQ